MRNEEDRTIAMKAGEEGHSGSDDNGNQRREIESARTMLESNRRRKKSSRQLSPEVTA